MKVINNTSKKLSLIEKIFILPYGEKEIKDPSDELLSQLKTLEKNNIIKIR